MTSTHSMQHDHPTADGSLGLTFAGRFVDGLAARDFDAIADALAEDVSFRALLPSGVLELPNSEAVRGAFTHWFGNADRWDLVEGVVDEVGGRLHLRWRVRLTDDRFGDGTLVVEQQVYADAGVDGRLRDMSLLCTGYRPEAS